MRAVPFVSAVLLIASRPELCVTAFSSIATTPNTYDSVAVLGVGDLRINDRPKVFDAVAVLLTDENIKAMPSAKTHTLDTVQLLHAAYVDIEKRVPKQDFFFCEEVSSLPRAEHYQVCDLGVVDNRLGYGAYAAFQQAHPTENLYVWDDFLRDGPWRNLQQLQGANYLQYELRFLQPDGNNNVKPPLGIKDSTIPSNQEETRSNDGLSSVVPTMTALLDRFIRVLELDPDTVHAEANTGLYATHWGGLDPTTAAETAVLSNIAELGRLDGPMTAKVNHKSLEHKSIQWQQETSWMIRGESTVRFLAAPLLMGTVSARRLLSTTTNQPQQQQSALKKYIEAREWHKLLAAATIEQDIGYGSASFKYWRWHGFLCRYVESSPGAAGRSSSDSPSLVLVHGFGASATQWLDVMKEAKTSKCYAPDQLGFGHAEKPGLSYTAYLWDGMLTDFCKEIVPNEYVAVGNSIGGFTSLSLAASDSANAKQWSSNGAPGARQCVGLVLCNSAGNIISKSEADALLLQQKQGAADPLSSIAKLTATGGLPPCRPPPRLVAWAFGNVLLSQLRPRIKSICKNLYPINPEAVDDELCAEIARDSLDPGAIHVMMSGSKLPPPRTANELLNADFASGNEEEESTFKGPVLIAQGVLDPLNAAEDRMNRYGSLREGVTMNPLQAGHCPHDEVPDQVASAITKWIRTTVLQSSLSSVTSKR